MKLPFRRNPATPNREGRRPAGHSRAGSESELDEPGDTPETDGSATAASLGRLNDAISRDKARLRSHIDHTSNG